MTVPGGGDRSGSPGQTVLYIGGSGRSGSTLLDRMLGEIPGFLAVGEIRYLWREGLIEDRLCGCGRRFSRCRFWKDVGDEAFGGWAQIDAERMVRLERVVSRQRHIPLMLARGILPSFDQRFRVYTGALSRLYRAVGQVSGAAVVVDSTKDPAYALSLRLSEVDLRIVHLVRDSRGVAFSWDREVPTGDAPGRDVYLHRYGTLETGARWLTYNALLELIGRGVPYVRIRYEDLVPFPVRHLENVIGLTSRPLPEDAFAFLSGDQVQFRKHHTVAGNPMRVTTGAITLRRDEEWERRMRHGARLLMSAVTWPLLARYGYPVRSWHRDGIGERIEVR